MDNRVAVGQDPKSKFCAYGDDSQHGKTLVYAFAIFHRKHVSEAEGKINFLRSKFNFPKEVPIHCRILFSGDQRRKKGLIHLKLHNIHELLEKIIYHLNRLPFICRFAIATISDNDLLVPTVKDFLPVYNRPKANLAILMQTCFAVPKDGRHGPPATQTEIFVSSDKTRTEFIGEKSPQTQTLYSGYSDIDAPKEQTFHIRPHIIPGKDWQSYPLLQVADVLSYICSHADQSMKSNNLFTGLLRSITYWSRANMNFAAS